MIYVFSDHLPLTNNLLSINLMFMCFRDPSNYSVPWFELLNVSFLKMVKQAAYSFFFLDKEKLLLMLLRVLDLLLSSPGSHVGNFHPKHLQLSSSAALQITFFVKYVLKSTTSRCTRKIGSHMKL